MLVGLFEEVEHIIHILYRYSENVTFGDILDEIILNTYIGSAICVFLFLIVIGTVYWFVRRSWQKRRCGAGAADFKEMRRSCRWNEIVRLLLVCWISGVVLFLIIPYDTCQKLLRSVRYSHWVFAERQSPWQFGCYQFDSAVIAYLTGESTSSISWVLTMLIGNAALYVPLGFALPFVWRKGNFPRTMLVGLVCSFLVEIVQPFFERSGDIEDLICNVVGVAAGYLLFFVIKLIFPKFVEKCRKKIVVQKA